jgi:hypothetical protein
MIIHTLDSTWVQGALWTMSTPTSQIHCTDNCQQFSMPCSYRLCVDFFFQIRAPWNGSPHCATTNHTVTHQYYPRVGLGKKHTSCPHDLCSYAPILAPYSHTSKNTNIQLTEMTTHARQVITGSVHTCPGPHLRKSENTALRKSLSRLGGPPLCDHSHFAAGNIPAPPCVCPAPPLQQPRRPGATWQQRLQHLRPAVPPSPVACPGSAAHTWPQQQGSIQWAGCLQ